MNFLTILRVALRTLRRTSFRSGLSALGIIIGVAAVVTMVSVANGSKAVIEATLASVDTNEVSVSTRMPQHLSAGAGLIKVPPAEGLSVEDYRAVRAEVGRQSNLNIFVFAPTVVARANGRQSDAFVNGVDAGLLQARTRRLVNGVGFGQADVGAASAVCVISEYVAQRLFSRSDVVGEHVRLEDTPFTVIGVIKDNASYRNAAQPQAGDPTVFVPYTSVLRRLNREAAISLTVKAMNPTELGWLRGRVTDLLEARRGSRRAEFVLSNAEEAVRNYRDGSETMSLLLGTVAGISLVVGGIGIMNMMMVGVTERTREIGMRMAIGTRSRDIRGQFLIESTILSVLGGGIGIAFGIAAARILTKWNGWPTVITFQSVLTAFLVSAAVGIFFGYYPARRAARLDPMAALRLE